MRLGGIILYLLLLPASITMTLLAYVLAPVLPVFREIRTAHVGNGSGIAAAPKLPRWLSWFDTPDNCLLGDEGHCQRWEGKSFYWQMVAWLWRNPAYGFEWDGPLAANINSTSKVVLNGNPWIKNRLDAVEGHYFCRIGKYFNYKLIKPLFGDTALMLEFGWKLQGFAQGRETEGRAMYVFSIRLTAFYLCIHPKED